MVLEESEVACADDTFQILAFDDHSLIHLLGIHIH